MSRRVRITIVAVCSLMAIVAGFFVYGIWAVRQVQPFYAAALQADPQTLETASLEMESRLAALVSDAAEQNQWQAAFSDDEVNGWLASALPEKFPNLLPDTISDPRVAFSDGVVALGFRYHDPNLNSVLTVRASAVVDGTDVVALRLLQAHAGKLPVPMAKLVESITAGARRQQIAVRWTKQGGDPVALIPIAGMLSTTEAVRRLDIIEFHQGELFLAGTTETILETPTEEASTEKDAK